MSIMQTFNYQRKATMGSCLWSIWLCVPSSWRGRVYRTLLRFVAQHVPQSCAYRLPGCYFKVSYSMDEALATEYVRTHTSIPVPKVLDVLQLPAGTVDIERSLLMISAVLPGTPLFAPGGGHRLREASEHQIQRVCECLRDWITQLQNLKSPFGERICGFTGGGFRSIRISEALNEPFANIADFHAYDPITLPPSVLASNPNLASLVAAREKKHYNIHLVHGDLLLHNILADSEFRLTGIVDWEYAAWMPEYWETISSSRGPCVNMWCWKDIRKEAFPNYEAELALDREVQICHGQ